MSKLIFKTGILFVLIVFQSSGVLNGSNEKELKPTAIAPPMQYINDPWVDSVFNQLTIEQRIAQLFMLQVYSNKNAAYQTEITNTIAKFQPGGVIFMQGGPLRQAYLNNRIQAVSKVPMLVSIDGEWGLKMRLDSVPAFPRQMQLGAISDDKLIYEMGAEIARQCKLLGIHINFAPTIDINVNKSNPVINSRSFGQDKINVTRKGLAYAQGMQDHGILAVGKHFPGHGDTDTDSHFALPVINKTLAQLQETELYPFEVLIQNGAGGIMVAHISLPNIEPDLKRSASLSAIIVDSMLKKQYRFNGLIFTDALNMKGVTSQFEPGTIEVEALLAGNDVLLFPENFEKAIAKVKQAVANGQIPQSVIDERCLKILKTKKWVGLDQFKPVNYNHVRDSLVTPHTLALNSQLIRESITIFQTEPTLPIKDLENKTILSVALGTKKMDIFQNQLNHYGAIEPIQIDETSLDSMYRYVLKKAHQADLIIVNQHGNNHNAWQNYGIAQKQIDLANQLAQLNKTVFVLLANPYALEYYKNIDQFKAICVAYHFDSISQNYAAQAIMGGIPVSGKLPVTINARFTYGGGVVIDKAIRLGYESPDYFGIPATRLLKVDSLIKLAIKNGTMPGAQMVYAKSGKVIYQKTYGYHTYQNKQPVSPTDIYDIASVTKVAATTLAMIKLYDQKRINPTHRLSKYLPELAHSDKKKIRINELMAHNAALRTWIPFYKNTLDEKGKLRNGLYSATRDSVYSIAVCKDLYLRGDYPDSIYKAIVDTPLFEEKKYRYSDLGFYLLSKTTETITKTPFDEYLNETFYQPLGMNNTMFNPYKNTNLKRVPPTENDKKFRNQIVHGYVNDPGAAMLGGISGHAGLFANANDLAKLGQLFLNEGTYGGRSYFEPHSIQVFNTSYFTKDNNRRGLGFDKPSIDPAEQGPACASASALSYGHSGFTGSYIWIDPANQSIFVFNTNRTFPDPENKKLVETNLRTELHQIFYNIFSE